jgi:hypothetical protein
MILKRLDRRSSQLQIWSARGDALSWSKGGRGRRRARDLVTRARVIAVAGAPASTSTSAEYGTQSIDHGGIAGRHLYAKTRTESSEAMPGAISTRSTTPTAPLTR